MKIIGIDSGTYHSGVIIWDLKSNEIILKEKNYDNPVLLNNLITMFTEDKDYVVALETMVGTHGIVGITTILTLEFIGRIKQICDMLKIKYYGIPRPEIKKYFGVKSDSGIIAELADRFAPGVSNKGKGTVKEPGFFYGMSGHAWQAFAVAAYVHDKCLQNIVFEHEVESNKVLITKEEVLKTLE